MNRIPARDWIAAGLAALAITGGAYVAGRAVTPPASAGWATSSPSYPGRCFPAHEWGPAPDRYRPCATIARVYEDGSVRVRVSDHGGTTRYTFDQGAMDR